MRPVALLTLLLLLVGSPGAAMAHAHLKASTPAADSAAPTPREIRVTFTEAVVKAFTKIELHDGAGRSVKLGASRLGDGDRTLSAPAPALKPGAYKVDWTAVAADTHRSSGGFGFTVR